MSSLYFNNLRAQLHSEMETAQRVGAQPVEVPSSAFDALAPEGETMIFVVVNGTLLASKQRVRGEHVSHAVLAGGSPVEAAGEFKIAAESGAFVVSRLNNVSGHYQPSIASLEVARRAFEEAGIRVRPGVVTEYDWQAP